MVAPQAVERLLEASTFGSRKPGVFEPFFEVQRSTPPMPAERNVVQEECGDGRGEDIPLKHVRSARPKTLDPLFGEWCAPIISAREELPIHGIEDSSANTAAGDAADSIHMFGESRIALLESGQQRCGPVCSANAATLRRDEDHRIFDAVL